MERFNYRSIAALRAESGELLKLLQLEYLGVGMDREEQQRIQQAELDAQQRG